MNYKIENGIAGPIIIFRDGLKRENYFNIPSNIFNIIKDLQKENQQLKEQLEYMRRSIERKEETIINLQQEKVPYTNNYVKELEIKLESSEKARKEALDLIEKLRFEKWAITGTDIMDIIDILNINKGE